ncbi:MAG: 2-succinyl-5-enolpyruvyl-6-hydroxy-3-cyclohexene-1-carboxylic-acid synthase [Actinomycetota bacterium]|nr:2-succinyl-5-enolpyruvyl-6-hydroxy-3-cyclohexene-1-carboxylic-acid synthase [Actinomycetota bacterium]
MSVGDVSLACASVFVDELARAGMRHACVSPGSRSTPIALALARHPAIELHVHLDERSSAFFALGLAKATGAPVAIATTSGTAAAELLPAVVEARMSGTPLILLTADRPPELVGTGANQTIQQRGLFGGFAHLMEPGAPPGVRAMAKDWRRLGAEVAAHATAPWGPRPIHVNLPFAEPLVPEGEEVELGEGAEGLKNGEPWPSGISHGSLAPPEPALLDGTAASLNEGSGIIVVGGLQTPQDSAAIASLAGHLRWPVLAEPISQLRTPGIALSAGQAMLSAPTPLRAEVVLQAGSTPTTRATQTLVADATMLVVLQGWGGPADPGRRASFTIADADLATISDELIARTHSGATGTENDLSRLDPAARGALDAALEAIDEPTELRIARDVAGWIPDGGTLFVGNSMPIRDLDYAMAPREGLRILANRGASGIDGLVSTSLGVAASSAGPTVALLGDLSLIHDVGGLLWNGRRGSDLTLVVVNNGGGTIFSFLGQRELPEHERLFVTPHGLDLGAICSAAGAGHERVDRMQDLSPVLGRAADARGVNVIEVVVDANQNRSQHADVQAAVDAALLASG